MEIKILQDNVDNLLRMLSVVHKLTRLECKTNQICKILMHTVTADPLVVNVAQDLQVVISAILCQDNPEAKVKFQFKDKVYICLKELLDQVGLEPTAP